MNIKSGASAITKSKADMSNFLIHLTKNGSYEDYIPFAPVPGHFDFPKTKFVTAKKSLIDILSGSKVSALAPFGHFKYEIPMCYKPRGNMPIGWLKAVCFSETPLSEIKSFYTATQNVTQKVNKYQKYGLAFSQLFVQSKEGHPVIYFDSNSKAIVSAINIQGNPVNRQTCKPLLPLYESFGPKLHTAKGGSTDYRWEREWRHVGDFTFRYDEIAFGLCPSEEIIDFEELTNNKTCFIDPDWDESTIKKYFQRKGKQSLADLI
ncbi:MAG: hypothetical protein J0M15_07995 [Deltaproteobacteria bacterium]|nr:hypothetical protein [Deltaproteobacteria bacterium]